jgi:two-component system phosphate regulon sensor histidine kinase PhoR
VHTIKGYGLGLSYVASVVQAHKGHIDLVSPPGEGSTFIIHLPRS